MKGFTLALAVVVLITGYSEAGKKTGSIKSRVKALEAKVAALSGGGSGNAVGVAFSGNGMDSYHCDCDAINARIDDLEGKMSESNDYFQGLSDNMDTSINDLRADVDGFVGDLNSRIDALESSVDSRFQSVNDAINALSNSVDSRFDSHNDALANHKNLIDDLRNDVTSIENKNDYQQMEIDAAQSTADSNVARIDGIDGRLNDLDAYLTDAFDEVYGDIQDLADYHKNDSQSINEHLNAVNTTLGEHRYKIYENMMVIQNNTERIHNLEEHMYKYNVGAYAMSGADGSDMGPKKYENLIAYTDVDDSSQPPLCGLPEADAATTASSWRVTLCPLLSEASGEGRSSCMYQCATNTLNVYVVLSASLSSVRVCEAKFIP